MKNDFLWVEKYRPKSIEDCILPQNIKDTFQQFVDKGEIPNLLLAGPAGCGKTTIARALCEQLGSDYIIINGSDEGRFLDTVRNQAKNFASTVSLQGLGAKHKVIIIDEATTQPTMYNSSYGRILRHFITTAASSLPVTQNKIIEPLHSRCAVVEFGITNKQKPTIAAKFFKRLGTILEAEGVKRSKGTCRTNQQTFP